MCSVSDGTSALPVIAAGDGATNDVLSIDESVAIMGVLDEVRRQIGVVYPGER